MIRIRDAGPDDLDAVVALCEQMHAETVTRFPKVERARVGRTLEASMKFPKMALFAIAEADGLAIGMISAVKGDYSYSTERVAASDLLFVASAYRGKLVGKRLIQHFLDWSGNDTTSMIGVSTGIAPERTGRLFELMGFRLMGQTYRKE